jgi:hypothetical protein
VIKKSAVCEIYEERRGKAATEGKKYFHHAYFIGKIKKELRMISNEMNECPMVDFLRFLVVLYRKNV